MRNIICCNPKCRTVWLCENEWIDIPERDKERYANERGRGWETCSCGISLHKGSEVINYGMGWVKKDEVGSFVR